MLPASVDLDGDVRQALDPREPRLVGFGRLGMVGDHRHDQAGVTGSEQPEVKVAHPVAPDLEPVPDGSSQRLAGNHVQQHGAGRSDQAQGPRGDDDRPDDAHDRVEPDPAIVAPGEQGHDGQDGGEGVGQHVHVGGPDVRVPIPPVMIVPVTGVSVVVVSVPAVVVTGVPVVGRRAPASGSCVRTLPEIAARAGVSVSTARNAIRTAARLGLVTVEERRQHKRPNLANVVRIVSAEWLAWLTRGGGFKKLNPTDTKISIREKRGGWSSHQRLSGGQRQGLFEKQVE